MEIMQNVVDYGDAPAFFATGVSRVFLVSPHIVRITYVRADVRDDGTPEHRVSGHIDCDVSHVGAINTLLREAMAVMLSEARAAPDASLATRSPRHRSCSTTQPSVRIPSTSRSTPTTTG